jgi:hypothetical protein
VISEVALDTDAPQIEFQEVWGVINSDLTIGIDITKVSTLRANEGICSPGVKLHGRGFIVSPQEAEHLGLGKRPGLEKHIRDYRNGRDLTARPRDVMVIDLFGLSSEQVRIQFPEVYQHLLATARVDREKEAQRSGSKDSLAYANLWWIFGKPRQELRPALVKLPRYVATVETTKHRAFQFLDASILPDNMLVAIASDDGFHLGVLSSWIHVTWTLAQGGTLEDRPRYTKSLCFDPFPFPDANNIQKQTIRVIAEELDAHRKRVLAKHQHLTLTGLYNVLEKVRVGAIVHAGTASVPSPLVGEGQGGGSDKHQRRRSATPPSPPLPHKGGESSPQAGRGDTLTFTPNEKRIFDDGLVLILKELHDRLDVAVAEAYGWPADLSEDEILAKLVALNKERSEEEKRGLVRWLRPDYQILRFAKGVDKQAASEEGAQVAATLDIIEKVQLPSFPTGAVEQTAAVFAALASAGAPLDAKAIAAQFRKTKTSEKKIADVLASLARLGHVTTDGQTFALRRVA